MRKIRLAYVVSHPIQYQAELLRRVAADPQIDLTVVFCSDFSIRSYTDAGFGGLAIQWDVPLTSGYRYRVLPRWRDTTDPQPLRPISRGLLRYLRSGPDGRGFHVVWVHGYDSVNSLHAIVAARLLGLPVLLRAESWLRDRARSAWKLLAKKVFFRTLKSFVSAVLPIGTYNAEYWRHYLGNDMPQFLMPYAVDNGFFAYRTQAAAESREELLAQLEIPDGAPIILFAGKLQERKHADHLLEAFLRLSANGSHGQAPFLVFVGEGEQRAALEQRLRESGCSTVRFAGFRNQSELPGFFDLASVFVLPSRHEPWGVIVNEAMAAGLPVIVSDDVGCAPDLVRNRENGFVYPVGNIGALTEALSSVLAPGVAERMGQRSSEIIARWSYAEDVEALRRAALHVMGDAAQDPERR